MPHEVKKYVTTVDVVFGTIKKCKRSHKKECKQEKTVINIKIQGKKLSINDK